MENKLQLFWFRIKQAFCRVFGHHFLNYQSQFDFDTLISVCTRCGYSEIEGRGKK
jgi:hypothetical protein